MLSLCNPLCASPCIINKESKDSCSIHYRRLSRKFNINKCLICLILNFTPGLRQNNKIQDYSSSYARVVGNGKNIGVICNSDSVIGIKQYQKHRVVLIGVYDHIYNISKSTLRSANMCDKRFYIDTGLYHEIIKQLFYLLGPNSALFVWIAEIVTKYPSYWNAYFWFNWNLWTQGIHLHPTSVWNHSCNLNGRD